MYDYYKVIENNVQWAAKRPLIAEWSHHIVADDRSIERSLVVEYTEFSAVTGRMTTIKLDDDGSSSADAPPKYNGGNEWSLCNRNPTLKSSIV